jgi:hypothetical protein
MKSKAISKGVKVWQRMMTVSILSRLLENKSCFMPLTA